MSVLDYKLSELQDLLHKKELKVSELTEASFKRIAEVDDKIGAFLTLNEEAAHKKAKELDEALQKNEASSAGILFGIPAGIKDNIMTKGLTTTAASKILKGFEPLHNATVMNRLHEQNIIMTGKLNMDEFAMGSSNENSGYKLVHNPWNLNRVPGGSSGGSAAAVAAGEVIFSLGSDTGGSIREPASYCGVVGMKPTYGRVSRFGLIAFASSFDQIGPLTRSVEDNAHVLQAISGHDTSDSTSAHLDVPNFSGKIGKEIKGIKIGVPSEYLGEGVNAEVKEKVLDALKTLEKLGAEWEEVSLPHSKYALSTYYLLASSEASTNLSRFDGIRYGVRKDEEDLIETYKKSRSEGFGKEVKRRIMLGTFALSSGYYDAYYKKAQKVRTLIKQDFEDLFLQYDVIVGPTAPTTAFEFEANSHDPMTMYANDILTISINLAGVPAISIPCGFDKDGMPIGLQIIGKHFDEETIYQLAYAFEQATEFHKEKATFKGGANG